MICIVVDDDKVARMILERYIKKNDLLEHVGSFDNAIDASAFISKNKNVDLMFLDIEMPEMNGLELLETYENLPQIIITSSNDKYALKAIEFEVTDYLLKPFAFSRFIKATNKALDKSKQEKENGSKNGIFIKTNSSSFIRVLYDDILWIEAMENYVVINTLNDKHTVHFTMKSILNKIPSNKFKRIHRSYIINIDKISKIKDNMVVLKLINNTKSIPIAKSYREKLLSEINIVTR